MLTLSRTLLLGLAGDNEGATFEYFLVVSVAFILHYDYQRWSIIVSLEREAYSLCQWS